MNSNCPHCGYDLTGLDPRGTCPECGKDFSPTSMINHGSFLERYGKSLILGIITLLILMGGGVITILADDKVGVLLLTLVLAVLPAFGTFVYWWSQRQEERERIS